MFDDLTELEIAELMAERDELLSELDYFNNEDMMIDDIRELEIYDRLDEIDEILDIIY